MFKPQTLPLALDALGLLFLHLPFTLRTISRKLKRILSLIIVCVSFTGELGRAVLHDM